MSMKHTHQPKRPTQLFPWFLIFIGLPFFGLGGWGVYQGYITLKWPHATAIILDANLRVQDADPSRQKTVTHSVGIRYKYTVEGRAYQGDGIEVASFGLQNSALAQKQAIR
jgi:hypothetical protein